MSWGTGGHKDPDESKSLVSPSSGGGHGGGHGWPGVGQREDLPLQTLCSGLGLGQHLDG